MHENDIIFLWKKIYKNNNFSFRFFQNKKIAKLEFLKTHCINTIYYIYYILIRLRGKFILFIKIYFDISIFLSNKYRLADVSISLK